MGYRNDSRIGGGGWVMMCVHCLRRKAKYQLCGACASDMSIRRLYRSRQGLQPGAEPDDEPATMEEVEQIIAEQRQCLPEWWPEVGEQDTEE